MFASATTLTAASGSPSSHFLCGQGGGLVGGPPPYPLLWGLAGRLKRLWELELGDAQLQDYPAPSMLPRVTLQLGQPLSFWN